VTVKQTSAKPLRGAWSLFILQIVAVLVFVLAWQLMTYAGILNPFYYGQPSEVMAYLLKFLADGTLLRATAVTFAETLAGFALGMAVGVLLGFALWWSRTTAIVLDPFLTALQAVPKITFAPIFILLIGFGFGFKVAVSFAGVVIIALMSTYAGTKETDADLIDLLRSIGANRWQQFKTVVVPTTLPWIIVSMEINVGFALTGAVVAEFIASNEGLGYMAIYGAGTFDMSLVLVPVLTLMLLAAGMYGAVRWIEHWLMPWKINDQIVQWAS
jgi:NitT/TauT family transport system permease protein